MARRKSFAIIGLNNFGRSIIETLIVRKQHIMVFDVDQAKVNNMIASYDQIDGVALDSTVKANLIEQGLDQYDTIIVTMASNIEASVLTIIGLQDIGITNIIAKSKDIRHTRILKALGITNIVQPDTMAGSITATKAMFDIEIEIQTVDENYASLTIQVTDPSIEGQSLSDLRFINNKDYNIVYVKRKGRVILPGDVDSIKLDDELLFIAKISAINDLTIKLQKIDNEYEKDGK
ncbi:MAG: TrkA family potassium uptake protein [Spiroplasma poulsonii]|uniref:Ktr system potassium uptake protein A n=1 Tax=Spiroplasma poulsonii TaxID=2138 RepID=A0A2P6FA64_9MOLU|nr:TrkA family potassium uptake protein [Spiroplasma poulsonii]KAF0851985.1 Ktr system potassium uptake protein A [Spiroplasma poulsonii]MBW1241799.1 TrkA family potassium uptake protein [Spiroplasma poulsonii]PQM30338.1 Ktr system potassium uptake protein A [Spiroplasma poulsonii]PWF95303.1 Ktr system potassium uptake protein A [Spiroplasma poulsonii]PWF98092.1 Ktr system potassium uptake protein A [Spiroplasma poulsonii]